MATDTLVKPAVIGFWRAASLARRGAAGSRRVGEIKPLVVILIIIRRPCKNSSPITSLGDIISACGDGGVKWQGG